MVPLVYLIYLLNIYVKRKLRFFGFSSLTLFVDKEMTRVD